MERGDIGNYARMYQACIWEGVLATPPESLSSKAKYKLADLKADWETMVGMWKPVDKGVKSLIDSVNRLGIGTDVITFLHPDATEPIYKWLVKKGVSTSVIYYESPEEYALDLRYNRGIKTVYVASQEDALAIGLRAHVVKQDTAWSL